MERSAMIQAEMESYLLNKKIEDKESDKLADEIEAFLNPPETKKGGMMGSLLGGSDMAPTMAKMQQA